MAREIVWRQKQRREEKLLDLLQSSGLANRRSRRRFRSLLSISTGRRSLAQWINAAKFTSRQAAGSLTYGRAKTIHVRALVGLERGKVCFYGTWMHPIIGDGGRRDRAMHPRLMANQSIGLFQSIAASSTTDWPAAICDIFLKKNRDCSTGHLPRSTPVLPPSIRLQHGK